MKRIPETYEDNGVTYVITRTHRRFGSVSIRVERDSTVMLLAPAIMPLVIIKRLVRDKELWILKHVHRVRKGRELNKLHDEGKVLYRGVHYPLIREPSSSSLLPTITFDGRQFRLEIPSHYDEDTYKATLEKYLKRWYLKEAHKVLGERAGLYSRKIGIPYVDLKVKEVSSIWGSCSHDQRLSFNWKLILTPPEVLDYVVIHEISHLKHKNHGDSFWECVSSFDPLYNARRRWLKNNSSGLDIGDDSVS